MNQKKLCSAALRGLLLAAGMLVAASGISTITRAGLGTTPISTVPLAFASVTGATFGTTTFFVNVFFVLLQWLLLGRRFRFSAFLQIPMVFVYGAFIDLTMALLAPFDPQAYAAQLAQSLLGNLVLAAGIVMQLHSRTLMQPGEALVLALTVRFQKPFGTLKIANDVVLVCLAALIGIAATGGLVGIREGTLVSAILVGFSARLLLQLWPMPAREAA